jgi:hypothetical protein
MAFSSRHLYRSSHDSSLEGDGFEPWAGPSIYGVARARGDRRQAQSLARITAGPFGLAWQRVGAGLSAEIHRIDAQQSKAGHQRGGFVEVPAKRSS